MEIFPWSVQITKFGSEAKVIPGHGRKNVVVRAIGMGGNYKQLKAMEKEKTLATMIGRRHNELYSWPMKR